MLLQTPRRRPPARRGRPRKQAHTREELRRIRDAAAATVRAGRLRIAANTAVLQRWRAGAIERGQGDWPLGEVLDVLARTGDPPRYPNSADHAVPAYAERACGFEGNAASLSRLFATPAEIGAAAVLLIVHEAWNLSVLKKMDVPTWWPNADREDPAVHQVDTDKARRGRRRHASNTLVDVGEGSSGRALRHVLELTAPGQGHPGAAGACTAAGPATTPRPPTGGTTSSRTRTSALLRAARWSSVWPGLWPPPGRRSPCVWSRRLTPMAR
ncbi:hypothetical protein [Streptomyces sp. NPDC059742]|uniref:hypothetical protein n=1 Tax=Streptomyces sp. NPDC059742 TaxID=3346927 RepID=UPI0036668141